MCRDSKPDLEAKDGKPSAQMDDSVFGLCEDQKPSAWMDGYAFTLCKTWKPLAWMDESAFHLDWMKRIVFSYFSIIRSQY